jgi:hypothetical protein
MYEVDMSEHRTRFRGQVPCRESGFMFDIEFQLSWRVTDPARIVQDGRRDVGEVYRGYLIDRVSALSERYGLEQRLIAERALKEELAGDHSLPEGLLLRNCGFTLSLGAEADAHFKARTLVAFEKEELQGRDEVEVLKGELRAQHRQRQLEQEHKILALQHQIEMERRQHELEMERVRELAQLGVQREIAELKRPLELDEAEHQIAIEGTRRRAELLGKAERIEFYQQALERGDVESLITLTLTDHPGDVRQVLNLVLNQRQENRENARKILETMLEAGTVSVRDLDETRRAALRTLLQGLGTDALGTSIEDREQTALDDRPSTAIKSTTTESADFDDVDDEDDLDD